MEEIKEKFRDCSRDILIRVINDLEERGKLVRGENGWKTIERRSKKKKYEEELSELEIKILFALYESDYGLDLYRLSYLLNEKDLNNLVSILDKLEDLDFIEKRIYPDGKVNWDIEKRGIEVIKSLENKIVELAKKKQPSSITVIDIIENIDEFKKYSKDILNLVIIHLEKKSILIREEEGWRLNNFLKL